ncbi:glycosyltransferase [Hydrogenophaga sp. RWCD_12]|uniref:glycosyltransferase n=1 Tax=Hydrogenophaga sp. RWCD_12 TaxID=3391190 RepID=UPI0039848F0F
MKRPLVVAPSLTAGIGRPDQIRLTGKFVSGMQAHVDHWDGPVKLLIEPDDNEGSVNLDDVWVRVNDLPFQVVLARFDSDLAKRTMAEAAVVMGGPDHRMNHAATTCAKAGVPFVLVTEYSLKTRLQIVDADHPVFWRRWRRHRWTNGQEKAIVATVRQAAGLQCNGTPTYDAYRELNPNTLLYFDSRVSRQMMPSEPGLASREVAFGPRHPIRLAFSGRLTPMKGADHLVKVAVALRELGVPFRMDIYGDGPLAPGMAQEIRNHGLGDQVALGGVLDFESELMPRIRSEIDLFVCCHRQGDPSCTYLETLGCGVPIVGYANEAFAGLLQHCDGGRSVPMDDWKALAAEISRLAGDREQLLALAHAGLAFAWRHPCESEFLARMNHLKSLQERFAGALSMA